MAYGLRPHEIFQTPIPIDLDQSISIPTPDAWKSSLTEATVRVLPLVGNIHPTYRDGWCTYTYEHVQAPELEIICGGVNAKTPTASSIWRQGHLMHFGFEQSPAEMNDAGRALLANSICYIARFTEDRPIVRTPSIFYSNVRLRDRGVIDRLAKNERRELEQYLTWYLAGNARRATQDMNRQELAEWYQVTRGYLYPDKRGRFEIDEEALAFGIPPDSPAFIVAAIKSLAANDDRAEVLLRRYVHCGPQGSDVAGWRAWWTENRDYLFFSDTGGFRWYIDGLAKRRQISSEQLRGGARATKDPISTHERPIDAPGRDS